MVPTLSSKDFRLHGFSLSTGSLERSRYLPSTGLDIPLASSGTLYPSKIPTESGFKDSSVAPTTSWGLSGGATSGAVPSSARKPTPSISWAGSGSVENSMEGITALSSTVVLDPLSALSGIRSDITISGSAGIMTETQPVINGSGMPTSIIPTVTACIAPTGAAASASASSLQAAIIYAQKATQDYIDNLRDNRLKGKAEEHIGKAKHSSIHLLGAMGGGGTKGGGGPCSSGGGLLGKLLNVVSCAVNSLEALSTDVKGGLQNIKKIKGDLSELGGLVNPLVPNKPIPDLPELPELDRPDTELEPLATLQQESSRSRLGTSSVVASETLSATPTVSSASSSAASSTVSSGDNLRTQYIIYASKSADISSIDGFLSSNVPTPRKIFAEQATGVLAYWVVPENPHDAATA